MINKAKRQKYPDALLAAARSAELQTPVVEDKRKVKRKGRNKRSWMDNGE